MRNFKVTFKDNDLVKKLCVYVHNIVSSKKLDCRSPLEVSEGFTQEISKFYFHVWEPICYFNNSKPPENPQQHSRWMGFEYSTGEKMCYYISKEGKKP